MNSQRDERLVERKLNNICIYIHENFDKLQKEFANILQLLLTAESYSVAYREKNMAVMHFRTSVSKFDNKVLKTLYDKLEDIEEGIGNEFFQQIDFVNIYENICKEISKSDGVIYIWKVKKAWEYIIYEIDRIINSSDLKKNIAVLKGIIAYY